MPCYAHHPPCFVHRIVAGRRMLTTIKVLFSILPTKELKQYLKPIATTLVMWNDDMRRHFRMNARFIFERLVRKFGYATFQLVFLFL